ncbi:magnesium transporter [Candidatus Micrarchaeota archaeon]|nr:magnesium transporter [Candidatus Micrarchaeota archaeon]
MKINKQNVITKLINSKSDRIKIFKKIPTNNQGFVLLKLPKKLQIELMNNLTNNEILRLIEFLDFDDIYILLKNINLKRQKPILRELEKEIKEKVEYLLRFDLRTAADLMSLEFVEVDIDTTFKEISKMVRYHEKRTGKFPTILVMKNGYLKGELSPLIFISKRKTEKIFKYIKKIPTIKHDTHKHKIIEIFKKNAHSKIIVLDENRCILGIIYSDDILRIIEEKTSTSLRDFAGIKKEEQVLDPPLTKVKSRYKWLIINLGTAFLAASIVSLFQETISAFVLLAVYMPIVAGMGGNAGTQTLAVMVRGLTLNKINSKTAKQVIINELTAGAINGIINGILVAIIASLWNHNPLLGLIIGIAMITNLMIAGLFGALIPLVMTKLGKDPASSATIFITTATDVLGFFVFLGLATLLL